ncbi:MAG: SEC-C domain-containing protein, partial [Gracilibacteraceae bacterium]|nr:SEC-C domain-containing protein [Gracilibacteraceae bacterium]
ESVADNIIARFSSESPYPEEWNLASFLELLENVLLPNHNLSEDDFVNLSSEEMRELILDRVEEYYDERERNYGADLMRAIERNIVLRVVDSRWKDHLDAMDDLRDGIGLRAYGQRDPLVEYRNEAYEMFQAMIGAIQEDVVTYVLRVTPRVTEAAAANPRQALVENRYSAEDRKPARVDHQVGRNDPCPCGSGKKYKRCCGAT